MIKFRKIISSKSFFFLIASVIVLGLNLTPTVYFIRNTPPGRTFALIHNNVQDFFLYQSLMNRGANGDWLTTDPYTTESHQPSIIFAYFVWLGKVSRLLSIPYPLTYHLVRIVLSLLFLSAVIRFILMLKLPYPRLAFLFFLFGGAFLHRGVPYMNWWTGMDAIRRIAYLPHHMFGSLFFVLSVIFIIKYFYQPKRKYLVILILFSLSLTFVHTPSLLILLITIPPSVLVYLTSIKFRNLALKDHLKLKIKNYFGLLIYWLIGLFFLFLMVSQANRGVPWSQYIEWEKTLQFPLGQELIGAFGIFFPFAFFGLFYVFFLKKFEFILIACWFFMPILLVPFATKLQISNIRLVQGTPYLPLAILATLGCKILIDFVFSRKICAVGSDFVEKLRKEKRRLKFPKASQVVWIAKYIQESIFQKKQNLALLVILIIFFFFTIPTLSWSIKAQIKEYSPIFGNVYFDNRYREVFAFINAYFPPKTINLGTFFTGNFLPAFTHTTSFIGHSGYTYKIKEKEPLVKKFFENKMTEEEAKDFLLKNKIALVFQGFEEKPLYNGYLYPNVLKVIYDKDEVTLYSLK